jgi:F420-dependent oxidoreductase-like protein
MRFAIKTAPQNTTFDEMLAVWKAADEIDLFESGWTFDHFYPIFSDPKGPCLEAWVTTTALAQATKRLRVGVLVTGNVYRHPAVLANMAVSVDHISGGRLDFGIGAAWHEPEHLTYGIPFPSAGTRIAMLDEACEIVRRLWTEDRVDHSGRFWTLHDAICEPKPVQAKIPIVIGGSGPRKTLRVVAKHADEWNAPAADAAEYRRLSGILEEHCSDVGRDPSEIRRSVQQFIFANDDATISALPGQLEDLEEAGVQHVVLSFYTPPSREILERLAPS